MVLGPAEQAIILAGFRVPASRCLPWNGFTNFRIHRVLLLLHLLLLLRCQLLLLKQLLLVPQAEQLLLLV